MSILRLHFQAAPSAFLKNCPVPLIMHLSTSFIDPYSCCESLSHTHKFKIFFEEKQVIGVQNKLSKQCGTSLKCKKLKLPLKCDIYIFQS